MTLFKSGKLWNSSKGDHVKVNGMSLKVEKVDHFHPEDEHEEETKELHLKGKEGEFILELAESLRTFYKIEQPDSYTKKKVEVPILQVEPE